MNEGMNEQMKGEKVMKTTKNIQAMVNRLMVIGVMVIACLQAQAVTYKNSYQGSVVGRQMPMVGVQTAAPAVSFQSTSALAGSGSALGANPTLNADGSVNEGAYRAGTSNGPRRVTNPDENDDDDTENGTPLGDAVLPLMLLACAYLILRATRRRREIEE